MCFIGDTYVEGGLQWLLQGYIYIYIFLMGASQRTKKDLKRDPNLEDRFLLVLVLLLGASQGSGVLHGPILHSGVRS